MAETNRGDPELVDRAPTVFLSFRRSDTGELAAHVAAELRSDIGATNVFRDADDLIAGEVWHSRLLAAIGASDATIFLMGPDWLGLTSGQRKIDSSDDVVRHEVLHALYGDGQTTPIPVLVDTPPPDLDTLPVNLRPLLDHHAVRTTLSELADPASDGYQQLLVGVWHALRIRIPGGVLLVGDIDAVTSLDVLVQAMHRSGSLTARKLSRFATGAAIVSIRDQYLLAAQWPDVFVVTDDEEPKPILLLRIAALLAHPGFRSISLVGAGAAATLAALGLSASPTTVNGTTVLTDSQFVPPVATKPVPPPPELDPPLPDSDPPRPDSNPPRPEPVPAVADDAPTGLNRKLLAVVMAVIFAALGLFAILGSTEDQVTTRPDVLNDEVIDSSGGDGEAADDDSAAGGDDLEVITAEEVADDETIGECAPSQHCAGAFGHPNIVTFDRVRYAFHGAGDYLLASDHSGWAVHARFSRLNNMLNVSYIRAVGVTIGETSITVGDSPDKGPWDPALLRVDGEQVDLGGGERHEFAGGFVYFSGSRWLIEDDSGRQVVVGDKIAEPFEVRTSELDSAGIVGMLGSPDGDMSNDIQSQDGQAIDVGLFDDLYGVFGASWLYDSSESPFVTPLHPVDDDPIFPDAAVLLSDFDPELLRQAEQACRRAGNEPGRGLSECLLDLVMTNDERWAAATTRVAALAGSGVHWRLIDPRIDAERSIDLGDTITADLETAGAHRYTFEGAAGARLVLRLVDPCGDDTPTTLLAGFMGPGSRVSKSISIADCGETQPLLLDTDGEHALLIADEEARHSSYSFSLIEATDRDLGEVATGQQFSGMFDALSEVHSWQIDVPVDSQFSVEPVDVPCDFTWVVEADGEQVWAGDGCDSSPALDASGAAMKLSLIAEFRSSYEFELLAVPAPRVLALPADGVVAGSIDEPGGSALYTFSAESDDLVQFLSRTEDCMLGAILFTAPSGARFVGRDVCRDTGPFPLGESGQWTVGVDPAGKTTGAYEFLFGVVPEAVLQGDVTGGGRITGSIDLPGQSVAFELRADAATQFRLVGDATECGLSKLVFEYADGSSGTGRDLCRTYEITTDRDTVRVVVDPSGDQVGSFDFEIFIAETISREFVFDTVVAGSIDSPGDSVEYDVDPGADVVALQVLASGTECGFSDVWFSSGGGYRSRGDLCEDHVVPVAPLGEYVLSIDPGGDAVGEFRFRVLPIERREPVELRFAEDIEGDISDTGGYVGYSFTVEDQPRSFQFVPGSTPCDFSRLWLAENGDWHSMFYRDICEGQEITISNPGSYSFVIDPAGTTTGSFDFRIHEIVAPNPVQLLLGESSSGSIDEPGAYSLYTFDVTEPDTEFAFVAGETDCELGAIWFGVAEASLSSYRSFGDLCTDHTIRIAAPGAYYFLVDPPGAITGNYSLLISQIDE